MADTTALALQIGVLLKQPYDYGRQVKGAGKEIRHLCSELAALRGVLDDLRNQNGVHTTSVKLDETLKTAKLVLDEMHVLLTPKPSQFRLKIQPLKWPFEKSAITEMTTRVERVKTHLLLDLTGGSQNLMDEIKKEVEGISDTLRTDATERKARHEDERRQRVADMLSSASANAAHRRAYTTWKSSPFGLWFIDGPMKSWLEEPSSPGHFMYLLGNSGAGKTVLLSGVAEHVKKNYPNMRVAYSYCNYNDATSQECQHILACWISQLPTCDLSAFEQYAAKSEDDRLQTLQDTLVQAAESAKPLLLVLDAVNEAKDATQLCRCFQEMLATSDFFSPQLHKR